MLTMDRRAPARSRLVVGGVIGVTVLVALLVRFAFINQISGDYRTFVSPWYDQLKAGGFSALGADFSNYNPPYLYLLAAVTYLPVPKIIAINGISIVFDLLLAIYPNQISGGGSAQAGAGGFGAGTGGTGGAATGGGGQRGQGFGVATDSLTQNAPTFYQWINSGASTASSTASSTLWKYVGLAAASVMVVVVGVLAWLRRRPLTTAQIVVLATTLVLAVPFLLPQMHERYFFLADVLTIVMAMYVRHFWPVAVVVSLCSLLSYAPFLWNTTPVALPFVAFAEFLAVIATIWVFFVVFRDPDQESRMLRRPAGARNPADFAAQ